MICFKEFPHTDFAERGEELVQIIADNLDGNGAAKPGVADLVLAQVRKLAEGVRSARP